MPEYLILLDPSTERFYRRVADAAGVRTEQVLSDALFRLAGELSFEALAAQGLTPLGGSVSNAETETPIHIAPSLAGEREVAEHSHLPHLIHNRSADFTAGFKVFT